MIRAEGVSVPGTAAGTLSNQTWERPDALYGPFDWTITQGSGELTQGTVTDSWGQELNAALFTPSEPGVSYLTATTKDGQYSVNFAVVCEAVLADTVDVNTHRMDLEAGQTQTLTATLTPQPTLAEDAQVNYISFSPQVASVDENGVVTAHKEGYAFIKVESAADNRVTSYCVVKVTGNMYQVKFMDDTGNIYKLVEVAEGSCVAKPQDPVREGYTFNGWFVDHKGTQAYDFNTLVTGDLTLFAKWTKVDTDPTPGTGSTPGAGSTPDTNPGTGVVVNTDGVSSQVTVDNAQDVFPNGTEIVVESIQSGEIYQMVVNALKNVVDSMDHVAIFEINAYMDGVKVQPDGKVQVTFAIPDNLSPDHLKMYYVAEDGTLEEVSITVDKAANTVTANLTHFSTYALVNVDPAGNGGIPDTGDTNQLMLYVAILMVAMGAVCGMTLVRKRQQR